MNESLIYDLRDAQNWWVTVSCLAIAACFFAAHAVWRWRGATWKPAAMSEMRSLALACGALAIPAAAYEASLAVRASSLVERCWAGQCEVVLGEATLVHPLTQRESPARKQFLPTSSGSFWIGERMFFIYTVGFLDYTPLSHLTEGDRIRVHLHEDSIVLVEKLPH